MQSAGSLLQAIDQLAPDQGESGLTPPAPRTRRGRARTEALIAAASREFLSVGYADASLRRIVSAAGGSMETLYRLFGSKENLFRCVVAMHMNAATLIVSTEHMPGADIEAELRDWGLRYVRAFLRPESLAFYAMMISEASAMPGTAKVLWQAGPGAAIAHLEAYLMRISDQADVDCTEPRRTAALFIDMVKGGAHLRSMLTAEPTSPAEIEANVDLAVRLICRGMLQRA